MKKHFCRNCSFASTVELELTTVHSELGAENFGARTLSANKDRFLNSSFYLDLRYNLSFLSLIYLSLLENDNITENTKIIPQIS